MEHWKIDINCDLGEGLVEEEGLYAHISSCNIACGGHAGDRDSMAEAVARAQRHRVRIGAHPSYPDRENFGRRAMELGDGALVESIRRQVGDLQRVLEDRGAQLHHIKAHGALYNQMAGDPRTADLFLEAVGDHREGSLLFVPYGSVVAERAQRLGFKIWYEAFADRNYRVDLSLVPRGEPQALIEGPEEVLAHVLPMIQERRVRTLGGRYLEIVADTLCVHGDGPRALEILMYLSRELPKHQVKLRP